MRNESRDAETDVLCETVSPFFCDIVSHEKYFVCCEPLGSVAIRNCFRVGQSLSDTWAWWHPQARSSERPTSILMTAHDLNAVSLR